jgi:hypothetical protein
MCWTTLGSRPSLNSYAVVDVLSPSDTRLMIPVLLRHAPTPTATTGGSLWFIVIEGGGFVWKTRMP